MLSDESERELLEALATLTHDCDDADSMAYPCISPWVKDVRVVLNAIAERDKRISELESRLATEERVICRDNTHAAMWHI